MINRRFIIVWFRLVRTFILVFGFKILAVKILTLKAVVVILNTFKSLSGLKSFTKSDYYKNIYLYPELCTKTNMRRIFRTKKSYWLNVLVKDVARFL